jgi:hypothetical protein
VLDYEFNGPSSPATFKKLLYWYETKEWAGMYANSVYNIRNPSERWTERYVWALRNGEFVELKQFDVRYVGKRLLKRR